MTSPLSSHIVYIKKCHNRRVHMQKKERRTSIMAEPHSAQMKRRNLHTTGEDFSSAADFSPCNIDGYVAYPVGACMLPRSIPAAKQPQQHIIGGHKFPSTCEG